VSTNSDGLIIIRDLLLRGDIRETDQ